MDNVLDRFTMEYYVISHKHQQVAGKGPANNGGIRFALQTFCKKKMFGFIAMRRVLTMRKLLLTIFCTLCLTGTVGVASAQQNPTPENKDKNAAEKTADKAKEAGQEVSDKAGDVKDKTVKGAKKTGKKTKEVAGDAADKADDAKDKTVDTTKKAVNEVGDKAEDAKDKTAKGVKVATKEAKAVGSETADKAGDVKDKGEKGVKKSGNWLTRTFKKIF